MSLSVFLDSQELEYGNFLPRAIEAAMDSALHCIAIFSKTYAESPWCLAELSFMLKSGAKIIPIFYHVDPSDLRWVHQGKGTYAQAFKDHERKGRYSPEQLQEWKSALHDASFYNGQIIKNNDDEMRLLKKIVNIVLETKINNVPLEVANHPVALEEIEKDFEMNTLQSGHAVQIVGIWGMGGSGKTTLAKYLYNKKSSSMERSSFIFDVRDGAVKGLLHAKQIQLLKDLGVEKKDRKFDNIEIGKSILREHLRSQRLLIILDDVDHADQLDALLPVKDGLRVGSLIIVTTRDNEVLRAKGISSVYKMRALDPCYAKQRFCCHAFSQSVPDGFEKLVESFLEACNGLPLSLKVFGAQLKAEFCKEYWESLLDKISRILPDDIKMKLKVSYDALDYEDKETFLDTACFFIGEKKSLAIEVWNGSGWSGLYSWQKLFNKCLVELDKDNRIRMHDHLRDLGKEIANQHSSYRLWLPQQIINAEKQIEKKTGIRGIMAVPSSMITWKSTSWESEAGMSYPVMKSFWSVSSDEKLMANSIGDWSLSPSLLVQKIFVIRGDYFNKIICEVSSELVWLRWFEIGQRILPSRLSLKKLRVLELYENYIQEHEWKHPLEELWEAESDAPVQLRELVISGCNKFQRFPNSIGRLNVLKKIVITESSSLTSLPDEFGRLQSLEHLQLRACNQLSSLPTSFGNLRNLRFLDLAKCTELRMLPVSFKKLTLLQYLGLQECRQLILGPEDFQNITKLEYINLIECKQLEELPRDITNQASLRELYLHKAERLRELPINIGQLSRLQKMSIGNELLTSLPTSLGDLSSLTDLSISCCFSLESLPTSLGDLSSLTNLFIGSCYSLESLPTSLGDLSSLTNLYISSCDSLESLPTSLGDLPSLTNLSIIHCSKIKCFLLPLERLNLLERLEITGYPIKVDFKAASLPFGSSKLKDVSLSETEVCRISMSEDRYSCLESLYLHRINQLTEIEALPTTVKSIRLEYCYMLKNIRVPCDLVNLEQLNIKSCPNLEELPIFARSTSLTVFRLVGGCYRIQKIEGLEYCTRSEFLSVETCWEVPGIQSFEHMEELSWVFLRANKGSAIERCIQTIKKWPDEIQICTRAAPAASSVVDSLLSPNLVVDSFSKRKIWSRPKLTMHSSNGDEMLMLCFVINCVTPQMTPRLDFVLYGGGVDTIFLPEIEKGRWVWLGIFQIPQNEDEEVIKIYIVDRFETVEEDEEEIEIYLVDKFETVEEDEEDGEEFEIEETEKDEAEEFETEEEIKEDGEEEFEIEEEDEEDEEDEEEFEIEETEKDEAEEFETEEEIKEDGEEEFEIEEVEEDKENEVERGLVVRGEKQRVVEAFHSLFPLLQSL